MPRGFAGGAGKKTGWPQGIAPFVFPGFAGRATGRDAFIAEFVDFCRAPESSRTMNTIIRWI